MYAFNYVRPLSVADAVTALGANAESKLLAGGQTLLPTIKQRLAKPAVIVDLGAVPELKGIQKTGSAIGIGAMTTHATVATNADVRTSIHGLATLAGGIGDPAVRNAGTIGGSLANNDPAACYPSAVMALNAMIVTNKRQLSADQYFTGMFSTALAEGEIITGVGFSIPKRSGYAKFEQRASRYALVGVFVAETASGVRVAVTGCGANGVFRVPELEAALSANFSSDAIKGIKVGHANLMGDMHGSAEYRAHLITIMAQRAVDAAK
jgi:aerobic carbon-monoxide dehydrogenase medium subunit